MRCLFPLIIPQIDVFTVSTLVMHEENLCPTRQFAVHLQRCFCTVVVGVDENVVRKVAISVGIREFRAPAQGDRCCACVDIGFAAQVRVSDSCFRFMVPVLDNVALLPVIY